jgi:hypothetical protein
MAYLSGSCPASGSIEIEGRMDTIPGLMVLFVIGMIALAMILVGIVTVIIWVGFIPYWIILKLEERYAR